MSEVLETLNCLVVCAKSGSSQDVCLKIDKLKQKIEKELKVINILRHNIIRNEMRLEWVEDEQQWYLSFSGEVIATGNYKEDYDLLKEVLE